MPCEEKTGRWAWKKPDGTLVLLQGDVRFEHVTFGYQEKHPILRDISLFAKPGQKIAFVGSTGAGKTTITNLINRFYDVQEGRVLYDGIDVKDIKKAALRRSLGTRYLRVTCSPGPSRTTSASGSWTPPRRRSSGRLALPTPTPSSGACPRAMTPW